MSLSRQQFEAASKVYVQKYSANNADDDILRRYPTGWTWNEHKSVPGLGYLIRSISLLVKQAGQSYLEHDMPSGVSVQEVVEPVDGSAIIHLPLEILTCRQYVVYSPTYQVPALYFSVHHNTGAPLTLEEVVASPLFRSQALPTSTQRTTFALEVSDSAFALLSQGDHPTLGTPCWYLHPCHTAEVVEEILRELPCDEPDKPLRWLEVWFMMLSNIVDFGLHGS